MKNKSIPNVESSRLQESINTIHTAMHTPEGLHKWDKPRRSLVDWGRKLKMVKAELRKRGDSTNVKDCPWCSDESTFSVQSPSIFECLGKACAPPPVGTGGSSPATQRAAVRYHAARKGGDVTAINKAAVAYGKARARDVHAALDVPTQKRVARAKRNIKKILDHTVVGPPNAKGRQKMIVGKEVQHLLLKPQASTAEG